MPASMISAEVGGRVYIEGSSMAIVAIGPNPGSTPISVPSKAPRKAYPRLASDSEVWKPSTRFCKRSMSTLSGDTLY